MQAAQDIQIVAFKPEHLEPLMEVFRSNLPEYFTLAEEETYRTFITEEIRKEGKTDYWTILLDTSPIGAGGLALNDEGLACVLTWGMVDRRFHKKGYGKIFLEYRLAKARELYPSLPIHCNTTPVSATFFAKYGFVEYDYLKDGWGPGADRVDMIRNPD